MSSIAACREFTIAQSSCPCILQLEDPLGHTLSLNLYEATVRPIRGTNHFHIQTPTAGAKVDGDLSAFTLADIETLICNCHASGDSVDITPDRVVLVGVDSWVIPADLQSVIYEVIAAGDPGVTPTITTTTGTTPLYENEKGGFSIIKDQDASLVAPLTITTSAGDIVVINFTIL